MTLRSLGMVVAVKTHFEQVEEALKPYDFYCSDIYLELFKEMEEYYLEGDIETATEIMLYDIKDAENDFNRNLPDWYKIRWSSLLLSDTATWLKAYEEYKKHIYKP